MPHLDIGFEWPVDESGYRLVERKRPKGKRTATILDEAADGTYLVAVGGPIRNGRPFDNPLLFMEFAHLDGTPEQCQRFASSFGYLQRPPANDPEHGEPISLWQRAIVDLRAAVEAWQKRGAAAVVRQELRLAHLDAVLVPRGRDGRPALRIVPRSLLAGIRLQFAQAITSGGSIKTCEHCGAWFEVGGDTGRRSDAQFHSDQCRIAFNNLKKREAVR